jgi:hypothetical protein
VVRLSVHSFVAHVSVAANVRLDHVPPPQRPLAPVGTRLARWLPTFLVIDGPLGRFLRTPASPVARLVQRQAAAYPTLAQARDLFNNELFRQVRNGLAHWAFAWEQTPRGERLVCFDEKSGARGAAVSVLEAEALHVASFEVIRSLDQHILALADGGAGSRARR